MANRVPFYRTCFNNSSTSISASRNAPLKGVAVDLIVEWEHELSPIWMFHLGMAAAAMNFGEPEAL